MMIFSLLIICITAYLISDRWIDFLDDKDRRLRDVEQMRKDEDNE